MIVVVENGWLGLLDAWVAAGLPAILRLYQNNYFPDPTDTAAAYVEATFSGYPGGTALGFGAAFVNGAGQGEIASMPITFAHNGGGVTNTVYGIYVTDGAGNLIYAERFGAPITMAVATDFIIYTPRVTVFDQ